MAKHTAPLLVLVGGFLGAGKTTLIVSAARMLATRGVRAAVITNDQDRGLVDTRFTEAQSLGTREVAGGCFCCRFSELIDAAAQLAAYAPDVIFAEPVGSCIDLSATILQPLKAYHSGEYRLAPLTVLFDPELAHRVFAGEADTDVSYLFRQQLQEADILCATKADLHSELPELGIPIDARLSPRTGEGVEGWLKQVLSGDRIAGARILDVDYQRYAEAEAALGWLNFQARIELRQSLSPATLAGPLLEDLDRDLTAAGISIAHLKIFDQTASAYIKAGITVNGGNPFPDGDLLAEGARRHELAINLRAIADPRQLEEIVRRCLDRIDGKVRVTHASAFRPSPPRPEHRMASV